MDRFKMWIAFQKLEFVKPVLCVLLFLWQASKKEENVDILFLVLRGSNLVARFIPSSKILTQFWPWFIYDKLAYENLALGIQKDYIGRASKYKYHILCNHWNGSILECSIGSVHILLILNVGRNAISFFNRDALDKFISHCNLDQVTGTQFPLSWRKVVIHFEDKNTLLAKKL